MKIVLITVVVVALIFATGVFMGHRIAEKPDAVTNGMLQEKIDGEAAGLNKRLDGLDAKLDILLNVATNAAPRDLRN